MMTLNQASNYSNAYVNATSLSIFFIALINLEFTKP